jgi:hypothetical protein
MYDGMLSPDFSPYDDYPLTLQLYNVFRNRWCGAYYQDLGVNVIPTITWSGERSFEFAFEGVEEGSTIALSTVGLWWNKEYLDLFDVGFDIMNEIIHPEQIIGYGKPIEGYENKIQWFEPYGSKMKERILNAETK